MFDGEAGFTRPAPLKNEKLRSFSEASEPTGGVSSPCVPPPLQPPPSGVVEEGGIGDLLLDNKPTLKEGHTNYITILVEDITEGAGYAESSFAEETTGASCRTRAHKARGDV